MQASSRDKFSRVVVLAQVAQLSQQPLKRFLANAVDGHDQVAPLAHVGVVIDMIFDRLVGFNDFFFDVATEWMKGKTLDEAETIKNTQLAEELALPPVKIHCSVLAEDAIKGRFAITSRRKACCKQ